jgi:hypothetical protein
MLENKNAEGNIWTKEGSAGWENLHNEELHNVPFTKYNWNDQAKEAEMGRSCSMNGKKRNA